MNTFDNRHRNREIPGDDKAAQLVARLYSGSLQSDHEPELANWISGNGSNRHEYENMLEVWDKAGDLKDCLDELETTRSWPSMKTGVAIAAGFLLVISVLITGLFAPDFLHNTQPGTSESGVSRYATAVGEQKRVVLEDGTVIQLNTDSRILVDYSGVNRRVILVQGEAFFEVSPDTSRQFTVDVGSRSVSVIGTKFAVQKAGFQLEVSVVEGRVAVHRFEDSVLPGVSSSAVLSKDSLAVTDLADQYHLEAGITARFSGDLGAPTSSVDVALVDDANNYPYWRYGQLKFENQPLYEVVREINRYSKIKVLIEDSRIMDMKISSSMQLDEIDAALESFEVALPVRITRHSDRIVITGAFQRTSD